MAFRWAEHDAQRADLSRACLCYLEAPSRRSTPSGLATLRRKAERWGGCFSGFKVEGGEVRQQTSRCGDRFCPTCGGFDRDKRARTLNRVVAKGYQRADLAKRKAGRKREAPLALATLTTPAGEHRQSASRSFEVLREAWKRLTNRSWWRKNKLAGYFAIEFGTKGNGYHAHKHLVLELPVGVGTGSLRKELRAEWVRAGGGEILDVRAFQPHAEHGWEKSVRELVKYVSKPLEAGPERLGEVMAAVEGKHLHGYIGRWRDDRREVEAAAAAEELEEATAEAEDSGPEPDVSWLPDGTYRLSNLAAPAKRGEPWALACLAWYAWDVKRVRLERASEALERARSDLAKRKAQGLAEPFRRRLREAIAAR